MMVSSSVSLSSCDELSAPNVPGTQKGHPAGRLFHCKSKLCDDFGSGGRVRTTQTKPLKVNEFSLRISPSTPDV